MKVSYLNNVLYRILIPPVVSVLVYLLMLLVFDRLSEISNNFSPEELFFLMFVTFFLFESYRFWIRKIENIGYLENRLLVRSLILYAGSLLITFIVVFLCISLYYRYFIGLSNFSAEFTSFFIVFVLLGILFHLFYLSILFLDRQSSLILKKEEINRQNIEFELEVFKNKLNPEFLYESLESLICMIRKNDVEYAEEYIDNLALFYRKIIGSRYSEIVCLNQEMIKVNNYLKIRNYRYSNNFIINWKLVSAKEINVVPNMILQIIQLIMRIQS
nr:histidine kinase [uncultured Marinifilum sp.]